jgi:hypothetical protein
LKIKQLLYLQIFNFFRKFDSNLQNGVSGSFVNFSKSSPTTGRHLPPSPAIFEPLPGAPDTVSCFDMAAQEVAGTSPFVVRAYKALVVIIFVLFSLRCHCRPPPPAGTIGHSSSTTSQFLLHRESPLPYASNRLAGVASPRQAQPRASISPSRVAMAAAVTLTVGKAVW